MLTCAIYMTLLVLRRVSSKEFITIAPMETIDPERPPPSKDISPELVDRLGKMAFEKLKEHDTFEEKLLSLGLIPKETPISQLNGKASEEAFKLSRLAFLRIATAQELVAALKLPMRNLTDVLLGVSLKGTVLQETCLAKMPKPEIMGPEIIKPDITEQIAADPTVRNNWSPIYRTFDGSLNHNTNLGQTMKPFRRLLPPHYADGIDAPRVSQTGGPLPSARFVSSKVVKNNNIQSNQFSMMLMQWGQFLDHDITSTPLSQSMYGHGFSCCGSMIPSECFPIQIPEMDPFYSQFGQKCMDFVRSLSAPAPSCTLQLREQMNEITAFIDASNVYGSSLSQAASLRTFIGGRLKMSGGGPNSLLPLNLGVGSCPGCFLAGDKRVNEQVELATMHTIWAREHNRIATYLANLNPHWIDETLFQEARRIVAAEMQHITYKEFLPIILGSSAMASAGILPATSGYSTKYTSSLDPRISNSFATAAFRFGHSLINGKIGMYSNGWNNNPEQLVLHQQQFQPSILNSPNSFLGLVRGLAKQTCAMTDKAFDEDIQNHLFQTNGQFGADLIALNIQRGRDHGLPSYHNWRSLCGQGANPSWESYASNIPADVIESLKTAYNDRPEEVDLFIAGVSENPHLGGIVGRTFHCILLDVFIRLRKGDRFFYEESGTYPFTPDQLTQIRKVSLSRVICDNSAVGSYPRSAFRVVSNSNPLLPCGSLPQMNLINWKQTSSILSSV